MDVRELKYDAEEFDFIVDKSTIDAILCGESSFINVAKMLREVDRDDLIFYIIKSRLMLHFMLL